MPCCDLCYDYVVGAPYICSVLIDYNFTLNAKPNGKKPKNFTRRMFWFCMHNAHDHHQFIVRNEVLLAWSYCVSCRVANPEMPSLNLMLGKAILLPKWVLIVYAGVLNWLLFLVAPAKWLAFVTYHHREFSLFIIADHDIISYHFIKITVHCPIHWNHLFHTYAIQGIPFFFIIRNTFMHRSFSYVMLALMFFSFARWFCCWLL